MNNCKSFNSSIDDNSQVLVLGSMGIDPWLLLVRFAYNNTTDKETDFLNVQVNIKEQASSFINGHFKLTR